MADQLFQTLPREIFDLISNDLDFLDLHSLRLTCLYFHKLIPTHTHVELLGAETTIPGLLTCVGCTRLRPTTKFGDEMVKELMAAGKNKAPERFCLECGRRPLPGLHRYGPGSRWREAGVPYVRCARCNEISQRLQDLVVRCGPCQARFESDLKSFLR